MSRTLLLLGLLSGGCGDGLAPPADVQGTWAADFNLPGPSLVLDLTQLDRTIAGSGTYAIEAGRAGTLEVTGSYARPGITLAIRYDYGQAETYTGTVLDSRHMTGTMADSSGHGFELTFSRR